MKLSNIELGKAGELRVASELILRGFNPALIQVDNGCDIVLENGVRIQVKTCSTISHNKHRRNELKNNRYVFSLARGNNKKRYTNEADYFICWCVPEDWFQVIPAKEAINKTTWSMSKKPNANWQVLQGDSSL